MESKTFLWKVIWLLVHLKVMSTSQRIHATVFYFQNLQIIQNLKNTADRALPLITYAPRGDRWGQASDTFLLCITCKKGVGGSR